MLYYVIVILWSYKGEKKMDILSCLFLVYIILVLVLLTAFKIVCFFKKSCTWKSCPFRDTPYNNSISMCSCEKCPYPLDEEEEKEFDEEIDRLESLISDLRKANKD